MDGEQDASSLLESVKAHVNERLKSPFGGAFLIAWVVVNWQRLFLLVFSEKTAEEKLKIFQEKITNSDLLWAPLTYAVVGLIAYYFLSGFAIVIFEIYGVAKRYVEQKFDSYRWVPPYQYIEWKKNSNKMIKDFQDLAADKLDRIATLDAELTSLKLELLKENDLTKQLSFSEDQLKSDLERVKNELVYEKTRSNLNENKLINKQESTIIFLNEIYADISNEAKNMEIYLRRATFSQRSDPEDLRLSIGKIVGHFSVVLKSLADHIAQIKKLE